MIDDEKAEEYAKNHSCRSDGCVCVKHACIAGFNKAKNELAEEIIKLREEIINNANCLNCGKYGGSFCHRKHARTFFHKKQSIAIYAPCKDWVSENSKMRNNLI